MNTEAQSKTYHHVFRMWYFNVEMIRNKKNLSFGLRIQTDFEFVNASELVFSGASKVSLPTSSFSQDLNFLENLSPQFGKQGWEPSPQL